MVFISLILTSSAILHCYQASPITVNDEFERKYEIHEDAEVAGEHGYPNEHSSTLHVRSAQSPYQFNAYPYQPLNQLSPYNHYSRPVQSHNQQAQIAAAQQGNHQYLTALQQYYDASRRPQSFSSPAAAYTQVPGAQQAAHVPYQHPLGVLYSAASDVSQFQYSGNGVNYAF